LGQPSLPLLNKAGYTMHWSTNWSNVISYKKFLYFDTFFKKFFFLFFSDKFIFVFIKRFYLFNKAVNLSDLAERKEEKTTPKYVTSAWFLHFQGWVVLSLYIYIPSVFLQQKEIPASFKNVPNVSLFNFFDRKQKACNLYKYKI